MTPRARIVKGIPATRFYTVCQDAKDAFEHGSSFLEKKLHGGNDRSKQARTRRYRKIPCSSL